MSEPETPPQAYGIHLQDADLTLVGGAETPEHAIQLAAGFFARTGGTLQVSASADGTVIGRLGKVDTPAPPPAEPFSLQAEPDPNDGLRVNFTLSGATADAMVEFGDGQMLSLPSGQKTFTHLYVAGTYHVVARSEQNLSEVYVNPS
jgi:hypothetical protein